MTFHERFARTIRLSFSVSCLCILNTTEDTVAKTFSFFSQALPIEVGETLRGHGRIAGEPECFRLEVPAAGFLMLDVAVPGSATAEPRLSLLDAGAARAPVVVEQGSSHLLVASEVPHSLTVCVGVQDPRNRLGDFKLRTAFQASVDKSADPEQIEVEPEGLVACDFAKSTDPEQIEVEPEGLVACNFAKSTDPEQIEVEPEGLVACDFAKSTDPEQIEVEPEGLVACGFAKSTDPEQIEVEPEGLVACGFNPLNALCSAGERDDHGDVFFCATPVAFGDAVAGLIHNSRGDDQDVFAFELVRPRTVRIETGGAVDTFGGLYDERGQRLAAAPDGGRDGNFRLIKTLQPGFYFVRVESQEWAQGSYSLVIDALELSW